MSWRTIALVAANGMVCGLGIYGAGTIHPALIIATFILIVPVSIVVGIGAAALEERDDERRTWT